MKTTQRKIVPTGGTATAKKRTAQGDGWAQDMVDYLEIGKLY